MVKARGDERGNACSFMRTLLLGDRNDIMPKIMFGFVKVNNKHDIFPLVTPEKNEKV